MLRRRLLLLPCATTSTVAPRHRGLGNARSIWQALRWNCFSRILNVADENYVRSSVIKGLSDTIDVSDVDSRA